MGNIIVRINGAVLGELYFEPNEWGKFTKKDVTVEIEDD
jgi:hypothetical protein